jgi:hypothetical protein
MVTSYANPSVVHDIMPNHIGADYMYKVADLLDVLHTHPHNTYKLDLLPVGTCTASRWGIKSEVKKSAGHCDLISPMRYSLAIFTFAASYPGCAETLADYSENMGWRNAASIFLPESCGSAHFASQHWPDSQSSSRT